MIRPNHLIVIKNITVIHSQHDQENESPDNLSEEDTIVEIKPIIDIAIAALMIVGFINQLASCNGKTFGEFSTNYIKKYPAPDTVMWISLAVTTICLAGAVYLELMISFWVGFIQSIITLIVYKTGNTIVRNKWKGWYTLTVDGELVGYGCDSKWEVRIPYHAWSQAAKDFHAYTQTLPKAN